MKNFGGIIYTAGSWWVCVLAGMYLDFHAQLIALTLFFLLSLILHYKFYISNLKVFALFHFIGVTLGLLFDGLMLSWGYYEYAGQSLGIFPLWLLFLWLIFPLNFSHSLEKFLEIPWLGALFGAIGGPFAYKAGPVFGILILKGNVLWFIGGFWAFYMVAMSLLRKKLLSYSTKKA